MKLYYSPTSPYVRKVVMVAIESGLFDRIEIITTNVWSEDTSIGQINPLGKVPTLECDDGRVLFDSTLICAYLDALHEGVRLFPVSLPEYWETLRLQVLGDGICNAATTCVIEGRRPPDKKYEPWITRQQQVIERTLDVLEQQEGVLSRMSIGSFAVLAALGYLDFRMSALKWRENHPTLTSWFQSESQRTSFQRTLPPKNV